MASEVPGGHRQANVFDRHRDLAFYIDIAEAGWMQGETGLKSEEELVQNLDAARETLDGIGLPWTGNLFELYQDMRKVALAERQIGLTPLQPDHYEDYYAATSIVPEGMTVNPELSKRIFQVIRDGILESIDMDAPSLRSNGSILITGFNELRSLISDRFDYILIMLNARNQIIDRVSSIKKRLNMEPLQSGRQQELLDRLRALAKDVSAADNENGEPDVVFVKISSQVAELVHDFSVQRQEQQEDGI